MTNVRLDLRDFVADGTCLEDDSMDMALLFNILQEAACAAEVAALRACFGHPFHTPARTALHHEKRPSDLAIRMALEGVVKVTAISDDEFCLVTRDF